MDSANIFTVMITAITVLGSASAWRFYEKKALRRERDEEFIRHDCKDRISKLEILLESSAMLFIWSLKLFLLIIILVKLLWNCGR